MTPRDVVCVSTNYWGGEWFRKQQFMQRFARDGHRVLYVEPSHSMIRRPIGRPYVRNGHLRATVTPASDRLWVMTPRTMLPMVTRVPVSKANSAVLAAQIRSAMKSLRFRDAALWVYAPEFDPARDAVPHSVLVSDLVDDLAAYELRPTRQAYVAECTRSLIGASDMAIYTTDGLRDAYPGARTDLVVPNGYDETLFHQDVPVAAELQGLRQVAGFVGTLFRHLDFELFRRVATEVSGVTLVLVGRVEGSEGEMASLLALPNVIHVPAVERRRVPEYVAAFDVCLVPFKNDAVAKNVSPLKAYEYLAMGKPVVSVDMPALHADPVAADVRFAHSREAFVEAVREVLDAPDGRQTQTDPHILDASWEGRYLSVRHAVEPLLGSTGAGPA